MSARISPHMVRVLRILRRLTAGDRCTVTRLAADFEVDRVTIYRDLSTISAAGVPIAFERPGCVRYYRSWLDMPESVRIP